MELTDAMKLARSSRALVFLGAGFSCDTPNLAGTTMKTGGGFSDLLADKVGLPHGTGLTDTSEAFLDDFKAPALIKLLIAEFSVQALLDHQSALPSVPWKQIYTTNYDDIVEKSYAVRGIAINSINPDDPLSRGQNPSMSCIHLNGSIIDIDSDKLGSQIKLTDSSYLTSSLASSGWAIRLRQDIEAAQAVFYIGYSTYDLDIARLLFEKPSLKEKSFFVIGPSVDAVLKRRIEKFGKDTGMTAQDFFEEIVKEDYLPSGIHALSQHCVRRFEPTSSPVAYKDEDLYSLLSLGNLMPSFVFESMTGGRQYVTSRKAVDAVGVLLQQHPIPVVVHSSLGNGKTLVLEMLKVASSLAGFAVFEVFAKGESLFEELESLLGSKDKLLFIIDNYGDWLDCLKFIGTHQMGNVSVLLAARSNTNDVLASRAASLLNLGDLHEVSADHMSDADLVSVAQLMDAYGFWGDKSSWPLQRKNVYLRNYCRGEWQSILLELFKAPQIKQRLDILITDIRGESSYSSLLLAILILAIVDYRVTTDVLADLCGERTLTVGFRQNRTIGELIDFNRDDVKLRSAVTGAFLLKNVADGEDILATLITVTKAADKGGSVSREYLTLLGSLLRFGNAQNFFPEHNRSELLLRYYEALKEMPHCKRYPLFWLQYAIACLFVSDYDRAAKFFAAAYSFAKATNFRTYQIDNHFARFLLLRSMHDGDFEHAMETFRKAKSLVMEQMRRERLHYPYRVGTVIGDWYDAFSDRLNAVQRGEIARTATLICTRIAALSEFQQQHRDIAECYKRMQIIIQDQPST